MAFGTYDAGAHPRIQVLLQGFRAHGDRVVERNAPLGLGTVWRVAALQRPWRLLTGLVRLARSWVQLIRRGRGLPRPDAVLVGYLGHVDVHLARLIWRNSPTVLDHLVSLSDTASDRRIERSWLLRALKQVDHAALRAADIPIVDTEEHRELAPPDVRPRVTVVPVGAPEEWFRPRPVSTMRESSPVRVIFYGLYTPLQGAPTIGRAIGRLATERQLEFTMVGGGQDLADTVSAASSHPNVTWERWVDPEQLPELVASHDICLGIFGTTSKALRVVPNKVYQGAAAGCAVVTSGTHPQEAAFGGAARFVPPGDHRALAEALLSLAADRGMLSNTRLRCWEVARTEFSPQRVVADLREEILALVR